MRLPEAAPALRRAETTIERFGGLVPQAMAGPADIVSMQGLSPHAHPALAPAAPLRVLEGFPGETVALYVSDEGLLAIQCVNDVYRFCLWREGDAELQEVFAYRSGRGSVRSMRGAWFGDWLYMIEQNTFIDIPNNVSYPIHALCVKCKALLDYEPEPGSTYPQPGIGIRYPYAMPRYCVGEYLKCSYTRGGKPFESVVRIDRIEGDSIYADMSAMEPVNEIDDEEFTVDSTMPEGLVAIFRSGDRLWGFTENRIYATARNAPSCWLPYPHFAPIDNAFSVGAPNVGRLLAGIDFRGEPIFFGSEGIIRIAGESPEDWRAESITGRGLEQGSIFSPATVGDTLFYLSPEGVCAYRSGTPKLISGFSPEPLMEGIGGSDGRCYILQARDASGALHRFRYDPESEGIYCEEPVSHVQFLRVGSSCFGIRDNMPVVLGGVDLSTPLLDAMRESGIFSFVAEPTPSAAEFGPCELDPGVCTPTELIVRASVARGARLAVGIRYGEGEDAPVEWRALQGPLPATTHRFALRRRSADSYALLLKGEGDWRVFALEAH